MKARCLVPFIKLLFWSITPRVSCFQRSFSLCPSENFQWGLGSHREASLTQCRRISIAGVSVSPQGFWAFLRIPDEGYWPLQITHNTEDAYSSTSAESLTLLQLISGVDMAGAVLPPDILAKLVVLHAESQPTALHSQDILKLLKLPEGVDNYSETNQWQRSRVTLPQATLDELTLHPLRLDVTVKGLGPLSFVPSEPHLKQVCWSYDEASRDFISLALALRYKAPIILQEELPSKTIEEVENRFPMYSSVEKLQSTSARVTKNIERGFEIHKLSGALRLAIEKGDTAAAAKIQQVLDKLESMDDLPTLEEDESELDEME
mmetsp:Transcript_16705/g.25229  ORF Transcript_16705/g.25229 Transcript_16705/m.25229 type:complete len:320 (-) Transcript_16705:142-1101(-)